MNKVAGRFLVFGLPIGLIVLIVVVVAALGATAPRPEQAEIEVRPAAVFVAEAEAAPARLTVQTQGEVRPRTEIALTAQISGRVARISDNFTQGGFFEAGEVLVEIEDADYRLAVTRAEAEVAQARQQLQLEQAESDLAAEEWEAIGSGEASALALREPQLAGAQAQLAAAEAALEEARLDLERTRISAPFAGRVREKGADRGQFISAGSQLGEVFSTDVAQIRLPLTDSQLGMLGIPVAYRASEAQSAPEVTLQAVVAGEPREWTGRLVRTDSAIDPQTRTIFGIVEVENPYDDAADQAGAPLPMGLFVNAAVQGRELERAFALPRSALRGSDEFLIANRDGTLSIRSIPVIDSNAERVLVAGGVEEGEWVITSPLRGAADGMAVTPLDADGEPLELDLDEDEERARSGDALVSAG